MPVFRKSDGLPLRIIENDPEADYYIVAKATADADTSMTFRIGKGAVSDFPNAPAGSSHIDAPHSLHPCRVDWNSTRPAMNRFGPVLTGRDETGTLAVWIGRNAANEPDMIVFTNPADKGRPIHIRPLGSEADLFDRRIPSSWQETPDFALTGNGTLFSRLLVAGYTCDHHETDLYVPDTPQVREIIHQFEQETGQPANMTAFKSDVDGMPWLDLPFHYQPEWDRRTPRNTSEEGPSLG